MLYRSIYGLDLGTALMTEGGGQKQQTYPDEKLSGQNGFFFFLTPFIQTQ